MICDFGKHLFRLVGIITIVMAGVFAGLTSASACSAKSDCAVATGTYRIFLPDTLPANQKVPAIIHAHGLTGSAEGVFQMRSFKRMAKKLGIAFVAVNGGAGSWNFPQHVIRKPRNDFKYYREVVADIQRRFPIDGNKIVASGFSIGASMTWNLACRDPEPYAGFIPVAGTLWRPQPVSCKTNLGHVHHYHGTADFTFPLTGRRAWGKHQGDVRDTFEILYRQDDCTRKIVRETKNRGLKCKEHKNCDGQPLSFCLHGGAHQVKASYLEDGFRRIAAAKGWMLADGQ